MKHLDDILHVLQEAKSELKDRFFVRSIGVFGSAVRDDFSPSSSDIDILVDFSKPVGIEFIDLANFLETKFQRKIDLVSKNGVKPVYLKQIENEVIYV
ncbi:MAG: nucleotidyltransferase family protein [Chitinophagaceae bacterium]|nr:nucleotidyltransferase family protein [Chitinophagaceae bacterium]